MKEILKFILLIVVVLVYRPVFSQRIINYTLLLDIDGSYADTDTMVSKSNLHTAVCYRCWKKANGEDSCISISQTTYDQSGRINNLIMGADVSNNQVDFIVSYKWLSDTTMESIVDYLPVSTMPDNYYIDTMIKGSKRRMCLFKADKNKHILVRSVYTRHTSGMWNEIKRYDLNNKLVEICYPLGNIEPKWWSETVVGTYDSVITVSSLYDGYVNRTREVYSKKGRLKEVWETSRTFERSDSSIVRSVYFYDDNGQEIVRNDMDENNQLLVEIRFYYKDNKLSRYTRDYDFKDSLIAEQVMYNKEGQTIYTSNSSNSSNYRSGNGLNFVYKYFYDERNVLMRKEYYLNDELQYFLRYDYK